MFANFDYLAIDRDAQIRGDSQKLDELLRSTDSRIMLWHGDQVLQPGGDVFFKFAEISDWLDHLSPLIYLGQHQQLRFFSACFKVLPDQFKRYPSNHVRDLNGAVSGYRLALVFHARGLLNWHDRHAYCSYCGHELSIIQAGHAKACHNLDCGKSHYPKLDPAVIFSVELQQDQGARLLLGRQPHWKPRRYSVIAGFVEPGESLEDAVRREAYEETGLSIDRVQYVDSQPWPFPDAIMVGFHAHTSQGQIQLRDQELEQASWFSADELEQAICNQQIEMPLSLSISWHLIDRWFRRAKGYSLLDIRTKK